VRSVLQSLPTTVTVMVLVAIFLGVACLGVWRGARRDPQDVSRLDNIASATLSLAMAGFTLVGSFAAYSLWNAETTRTALLGTELAAARAMLTEAGMTSDTVKAGCAKCGACSSLSSFEKPNQDAFQIRVIYKFVKYILCKTLTRGDCQSNRVIGILP
jgi:ABC-type nickel/cobalt efflux system permease component RcnA